MRALAAVVAAVAVALLLWWPRPATPAPLGTQAGAAHVPDAALHEDAPSTRRDGAGVAPAAGGALTGNVVDRQGNAIAGAEVTAVALALASHVAATTAANGAFTLRDVPRASLRLLVRHRDFVTANVALDELPREPLRIELGRRPLLRGRAVDAASGAPVAHLQAALVAIDDAARAVLPSLREPPPGAASFDRADGTFELVAETGGPHALHVFPARGVAAPLRVDLAPDGVLEVTVAIAAGVRARGVVRDADGQFVAGAQVVLNARPAGGGGGAAATTGADGTFVLPEVAAGDHAFAVFPIDGPALVDHPVQLELASPEPFFALQLPAGASASGTVQPWRSGQGAEVVFAHERGPVRRASVDRSSGAFAIADLTPGAYSVFVERTEPTWRSRVARQLREAGPFARIELPPGSSGRVECVDPVATMARVRGRIAGHAGPERLTVCAFCEDAPLPERVTGLFHAVPQRDGAFELDGFVPGHWRLQAMAGDEVLAWDVVDLAPAADIEFVLRVGDRR